VLEHEVIAARQTAFPFEFQVIGPNWKVGLCSGLISENLHKRFSVPKGRRQGRSRLMAVSRRPDPASLSAAAGPQ
jgi:hypothetical protein